MAGVCRCRWTRVRGTLLSQARATVTSTPSRSGALASVAIANPRVVRGTLHFRELSPELAARRDRQPEMKCGLSEDAA